MDGLATCRKAAGLTQAALAAILGVSQAAVAAWESGAKLPSAHKLPAIAAALRCTIDDLYNVPA
ncbi:MAG: helix-turn-helix transcriptional regulator [Oscillospiraceae bacterium]